jgi:hypothetical protein
MSAQEATRLKNPSSQPSPSFLKGGVRVEVVDGDQLARSAGQATVARGQPEGDLACGGEKLGTVHCDSAPGAHGVPFPLRLSRPPGVGPGFPLRASCAHCAFLRTGGAVGPAPLDQTTVPRVRAWTATRTRCAYKGSFRNRFWGAALVGSRGFPDSYPRPAGDHMPPPPLPPRCQKPAFCLSAVKWRVFIDATAILRCARFQLLRCVAPHKTRCLRAAAQLHVCCGDPLGKTSPGIPYLGGVLEFLPMQIQIRTTVVLDNRLPSHQLPPTPSLCQLPAWHPSAFKTALLTIH